jgi:hypothetical protein
MADSDRCSRYFEKFDYPMLKFDYPMLWLNYEDKMDELRNRFLTIASILFAVQVGIFALIVDKIILTEAKNGTLESRHFIAGIVLIIFSVIILLFLH